METSVALFLFLAASETAFALSKDQEMIAFINETHEFGLNIEKNLAAQETGNFALSAVLISLNFGMLYPGCRGRTAEEMKAILWYKNGGLSQSHVNAAFKRILDTVNKEQEFEEYTLNSHSVAFTQKSYPILQKYKNDLMQNYHASVCEVDFQNEAAKAVQKINDWGKSKTNDQIKKLFDRIHPSTVAVLLNSGYYKGTWKTKFDHKHTSKKPFYNNGSLNGKKDVDMMHIVGEFLYETFDGGSIVGLPFIGDRVFLIVYLPAAKEGLYEAVKNFTGHGAPEAFDRARKAKVELSLPKLKLRYGKVFNRELRELGLEEIFKTSADLRGISEADRKAVSQVLYKETIKLNEEYFEATGISALVIGTRSESGGENKVERKAANEDNKEGSGASSVTRTEDEIIKVNCNRPFLIVLYDKINGIYVLVHVYHL